MILIDPRFVDVIEWTDRVAPGFSFPIFSLDDPEKWQEWARNVIQYPKVSATHPPNPDLFEDWREWAIRFNQAMEFTNA